MLERILGEYEVLTMLRSSKSPKPGTKLFLSKDGVEGRAEAEVTGRQGNSFSCNLPSLFSMF